MRMVPFYSNSILRSFFLNEHKDTQIKTLNILFTHTGIQKIPSGN